MTNIKNKLDPFFVLLFAEGLERILLSPILGVYERVVRSTRIVWKQHNIESPKT